MLPPHPWASGGRLTRKAGWQQGIPGGRSPGRREFQEGQCSGEPLTLQLSGEALFSGGRRCLRGLVSVSGEAGQRHRAAAGSCVQRSSRSRECGYGAVLVPCPPQPVPSSPEAAALVRCTSVFSLWLFLRGRLVWPGHVVHSLPVRGVFEARPCRHACRSWFVVIGARGTPLSICHRVSVLLWRGNWVVSRWGQLHGNCGRNVSCGSFVQEFTPRGQVRTKLMVGEPQKGGK